MRFLLYMYTMQFIILNSEDTCIKVVHVYSMYKYNGVQKAVVKMLLFCIILKSNTKCFFTNYIQNNNLSLKNELKKSYLVLYMSQFVFTVAQKSNMFLNYSLIM